MRNVKTDPFLLALLEGGQVELHELPKPPPEPRPQKEAPRPPKCKPWTTDIDWEKTLPPSSGDFRNPLDRTPPAPRRACSQQFIDLYTDGAGHCFSDADPGL